MHFSGVQLRPHTLFISHTVCFTGHRELNLLTTRGYTLTHAEAFDLFPRCGHIETIVCLKKMIVDA